MTRFRRGAHYALLAGLVVALVATMVAAVGQPDLVGTVAYVLLLEVPLLGLLAIVAGAF